jgi:predicted transcriptional regulator
MTLPYVKGSATSEAAAESMEGKSPGLRERVFRVVQGAGSYGMTADEIEEFSFISGNTVRPRLVELRRAGRIQHSGVRQTRSGRRAYVWVAVEATP